MNYKMKKFLILEGLKKHLKLVVGTARFELATYGTQNRRATRLRYAPTGVPSNEFSEDWKEERSLQTRNLARNC